MLRHAPDRLEVQRLLDEMNVDSALSRRGGGGGLVIDGTTEKLLNQRCACERPFLRACGCCWLRFLAVRARACSLRMVVPRWPLARIAEAVLPSYKQNPNLPPGAVRERAQVNTADSLPQPVDEAHG